MKLEVVAVSVSDVDQGKGFYTRLGWRLDADIGHELQRLSGEPREVFRDACWCAAQGGGAS